ncbi:MAG: sodium:calcium symporter [Candidatus Raymondbacteria bacterium RifOxyC12_full_50_8]|uniref:Sodium:calcium symporter n=1 Tax=Candidatus Raymondbacteria bacterium RIFOXYD12_FULL_49_13 TaxID=1817890 RepID=A0A1F7F374_UNCRA|nr:MAG: sodium:calcium symporter [Candidatus Raymondbacteria bacterium RIFOXYA2_FULL_49_16]OGJ96790.1 MAG: sodium:calcium symporter [Candidatus Raymondbacteria bacterium RifOxyC12_full_50_8]OGK01120.1 MAG: sodium:calcium symporter [Candidatus Raymondbacteria bacterium RIFOXYD12_FULL_49_13]OGP39341.1 MAG: sodium:calcium symporter [Candidatus Raymondbacteria bacterium RIFOXYB2_FULL_49_35]
MASENWGSKLGVILAVAGSAVGLGNFLRFPGQAVANGGGAFMIPYFISFLLLGIPICWLEWALGRYGGRQGHNSPPGIFYTLSRHPSAKYLGVFAILIPMVIYMYYVYIESWCLGYAFHFLKGTLSLGKDPAAYGVFFEQYVGMGANGSLFSGTGMGTLFFLAIAFFLNFVLVYRGITKGIEAFCKIAMPLLLFCAVIILVRVLTLGTPDPLLPNQNVFNGLGFMWNPDFSRLTEGKVWMAAAGQIFFSLSVGFGLILTYSSYVKKDDDVVLSGLTASSTNEFSEVILGGLITIPAAYIFLGAAPIEKIAGSTLGLGFYTIPVVFNYMHFGQFFGFLWFFLLFLAALTSSISMLQPAIAFIEQAFGVGRKASVAGLGVVTAFGTLAVIYLSKNLAALDTMDFWVGTAFIYLSATVMVIFFSWVFGIEKGLVEANRGASFPIPRWVGFVMKYVTPLYLIAIFCLWVYNSAGAYVQAALENPDVLVTLIGLGLLFLFILIMIKLAGKRWAKTDARGPEGAL